MKKVLLSLTAAAAFVFAAGTVSAQTVVNGPITGKTQVVQANANLQDEIRVTIPSPGADGGAVRFGTVPKNSAINMDPRGVASTNIGYNSSPAMITITSSVDEPLRIEYPGAITLQNSASTPISYITYRPQISARNGINILNAANRQDSKYLNSLNPGQNQVTADGGTGEGAATTSINGYVVMSPSTDANPGNVTLFVGGKLYDGDGLNAPSTNVIPISKRSGYYDGEFTLNILYLN